MDSAVIQRQSESFMPQRAKVEGQLPPKHIASNLYAKKLSLLRTQRLLPTTNPVHLKLWNCRHREKLLRKD